MSITKARRNSKILNLTIVALLFATLVALAAFPNNAKASTDSLVASVGVSQNIEMFSVSSAATCSGYWRQLPIKVGFLTYATVHVDVGMCSDGKKAWVTWGPNCYATGISWPYRIEQTWCGVWNNNNWQTQPGMNFKIIGSVPAVGDVVIRTGWMRFSVYGDGAALPTTGGLS
jgi:hypothetical protein